MADEPLKKLEEGWLEKNKHIVWNSVYAPYTTQQMDQVENMKIKDQEKKKT